VVERNSSVMAQQFFRLYGYAKKQAEMQRDWIELAQVIRRKDAVKVWLSFRSMPRL
jgi:RNase P subunit RPR2